MKHLSTQSTVNPDVFLTETEWRIYIMNELKK